MKKIKGYKVVSLFNNVEKVYNTYYACDYKTLISCFNAAKRASCLNIALKVLRIY